MAFFFNFRDPGAENRETAEITTKIKNELVDDQSGLQHANIKEAREIKRNDEYHQILIQEVNRMSFELDSTASITCLDPRAVEMRLLLSTNDELSTVMDAVSSGTDLVPGKYEGGLTIWECSVDLAKFIWCRELNLEEKKVVELGCGAGLPGICTMMKKAAKVVFQDFNHEVLENFTIPNAILNSSKCNDRCSFYSCDWSCFSELLQKSESEKRFDIILTAETIYSRQSYRKLLQLFDELLTKNGDIYLAAKLYYFGVGGGTRQFEEVLDQDRRFCSTLSHTVDSGVPREILHITRQQEMQ